MKSVALKTSHLSVITSRLRLMPRLVPRLFTAAWNKTVRATAILRRSRRPLVMIAFTLVGCSNQLVPAATPTTPATTLRLFATTPTIPLINDLTQAYAATDPAIRFEVATGSFDGMVERVTRGEAPYFFTNHLPPDAEARGLWAAPVGQDGIAVIVHPDNPIQSLSSEQLRDIFQGRIDYWGYFDALDTDITVFSREDGSGTRSEFESLIMGERRTTRSAQIAPSSAAMRLSVARTSGGIGYMSMSYLDSSVRAIAIDGIAPTLENVTSNAYPLRSTLFVVGLHEPETDYRSFIAWVQSPNGQAVVGRHYAPMN